MQIQRHDWRCTTCGAERDLGVIEARLLGMLQQVRQTPNARLRWACLAAGLPASYADLPASYAGLPARLLLGAEKCPSGR
jgi:hypothetical protein